ncbi:E3 ubiquitin/ISG15 ligase TRIM25-like isoform X1 [Sphaeramia orbicularis]|uniref:E3 ubiquitin/ISG15 ligase TRIM25-like isoform X1 n=2 Tax=Sphaeramia orbicularis TaxID=375764 RepID=UPI0011807681|nr:E3 ubiquitin/ISG15 ligase TRIM25-like isoform X1 [Sphaeramia orbicularis]
MVWISVTTEESEGKETRDCEFGRNDQSWSLRCSGDMAAAGRVRSEDQFLCSICLDVFTDPVTTSCGHNFCKSCISEHWRVNVPYQCPMCKEEFNTKPQLKINTIISEMVAQFRHEAQHEPNIYSSDQQAAKPGEVPCDVCTEPKLKALKSCLVCLTSYCRTHVDPSDTFS